MFVFFCAEHLAFIEFVVTVLGLRPQVSIFDLQVLLKFRDTSRLIPVVAVATYKAENRSNMR